MDTVMMCLMMWPAPRVTADSLLQALHQVNNFSHPIAGGMHGAGDLIDGYLRWANEAARILGPVLQQPDLQRLVQTPRYWAVLANPAPTAPVIGSINDETRQREADLQAAVSAATELARHWKPHSAGTRIVVPDTGLLLNHRLNGDVAPIDSIDWRSLVRALEMEEVRVVIPILVVDELEGIKDKRRDDLGRQARRAVNQLFDWFHQSPSEPHTIRERDPDGGGVYIELLPDPRGHLRLPRNDDELVDRAAAIHEIQSAPVHLIAYDSGAVLRANLAGLRGIRLRDAPTASPSDGSS